MRRQREDDAGVIGVDHDRTVAAVTGLELGAIPDYSWIR
jgi:hypothetical protein